MEEAHPWVFIMITSLNVEKELCLKKRKEFLKKIKERKA